MACEGVEGVAEIYYSFDYIYLPPFPPWGMQHRRFLLSFFLSVPVCMSVCVWWPAPTLSEDLNIPLHGQYYPTLSLHLINLDRKGGRGGGEQRW